MSIAEPALSITRPASLMAKRRLAIVDRRVEAVAIPATTVEGRGNLADSGPTVGSAASQSARANTVISSRSW